MPGGAEIRRHLCRIGRSSRPRTYHDSNSSWANPGRGIGDVCGGQVPQAAPYAIAGHRIPNGTINNKTNARP
jgi:hypothetical protein